MFINVDGLGTVYLILSAIFVAGAALLSLLVAAIYGVLHRRMKTRSAPAPRIVGWCLFTLLLGVNLFLLLPTG